MHDELVVNNASFLAITIACSLLPSIWLAYLPFRHQLRFSVRRTLLWVLCSVGVVIVVIVFVYRPYHLLPNMRIYFSLAVMLLYFSVYVYLIKAPFTCIIFVIFFVKSYMDTISFFHSVLFAKCLEYTEGESLFIVYVGLFAGILIVMLPLAWLFTKNVLQPLLEAGINNAFGKYLCAIPVLFYIFYRFNFTSKYLKSTFVLNEKIIFLQCLWIVMILLVYYVILKMLREIEKNTKMKQVLHASEIQLLTQKEQYKELRRSIEANERARHDFRQHLLAINNYVVQKNLAGLSEYIGSYLNTLPSPSEAILCENITVNAIVQYYVGLAKEKQIEVTTRLRLPEKLVIAETDCCIVLGNLLENAIEACLRQQVGKRFIRIKVIAVTEASIAIAIINSFSHVIREEGGCFLSSKHDERGIGTASVRSVAAKYNGMVRYTYEKGIFQAAVLLNEPTN